MIKLTILYREPADKDAFELYYNANLALMEKIPHVIQRQVSHIYGSPSGTPVYYRSLELFFENQATLDAAMRSTAGVEAGQHLMSFAAQLADLFFSEVYEEAGGATPNALPVQGAAHPPEDGPDSPQG